MESKKGFKITHTSDDQLLLSREKGDLKKSITELEQQIETMKESLKYRISSGELKPIKFKLDQHQILPEVKEEFLKNTLPHPTAWKKIDSLSNQFYEDLQKICQMIKKFVGLLEISEQEPKDTEKQKIIKIICKIVARQFQKTYCSDRDLTAEQLFRNETLINSTIKAIHVDLSQVPILDQKEEEVPRT